MNILPHAADPEAEATALGAIILASPPWAEVEGIVSEGDFTVPFHRHVFSALAVTSGKPFDPVLIRRAMGGSPDDARAISVQLMKLTDGVPKSARWKEYLAPVRALSLERQRRNILADLINTTDAEAQASMLAAVTEIHQTLVSGDVAGLPWLDLDTKPEPGKWLVRGIIPQQGRTLVIAPSGVGKSWVLEDWALCVSLGKPWLGLEVDFPIAENRGPIMIIDEESSEARIHYRLARLAEGHGISLPSLRGRLLVCCLAGINVGNARTWGLLMSEVRKRKPCLVIMDAAIRILDGDEDKSEVISRFWRAVGALQVHGTAVAIAHHTGWDERGRSRGSSDFPGGADVEVTLFKTDTADRVKLVWTKVKDRAESTDPDPIFIDRAITPTRAVLRCGGDAKKLPVEEVAKLTHEALLVAPNKFLTRVSLLQIVPTSSSTFDRAVKILKDSNRLMAKADGYEAV